MFGTYEHTIDSSGGLHLPHGLMGATPWKTVYCWPSPYEEHTICFAGSNPGAAADLPCPVEEVPVKDGAVLLPEHLLSRLGTREVVLVGVGDRAEVWPRETWENQALPGLEDGTLSALLQDLEL